MGNAKSSEAKEEKIASIREKKASTKISNGEERKEKLNGTTKRGTHSARASMSSQGNKKPILTVSQRTIIKYCMDNAKDDVGERIVRRAAEKKDEFRTFMDNLPREQRQHVGDGLKKFLRDVCDSLMDSETIVQKSADFGASHVPYRAVGFKPDYFACTADAVTTECTFLDAATHGASETAAAWSQLTSFVFSAVRDGYYAKLREQRKVSNAFRTRQSFDVSTDGSTNNDDSRRSLSPNENAGSGLSSVGSQQDLTGAQSADPPSNFLLPPTVY